MYPYQYLAESTCGSTANSRQPHLEDLNEQLSPGKCALVTASRFPLTLALSHPGEGI
jgi:hypothetical protein